MDKILFIDDEGKLRVLLARIIGLEGFEVLRSVDCKTGLKKLEQDSEIAVVLCDVKLPDGNGVEPVLKIKTAHPSVEVILLTAHGTSPPGYLSGTRPGGMRRAGALRAGDGFRCGRARTFLRKKCWCSWHELPGSEISRPRTWNCWPHNKQKPPCSGCPALLRSMC